MKKIKNILLVLSILLIVFSFVKLNAQDVSQMVNFSGYCIFEKGLKKGMYSDNNGQTKILQYMLASFGKSVYPKSIITGYFGDLTRDAIARFQARVGLTQTGYLDDQTWSVFCNLYHSGTYCPISVDSMKNGDEDSNGNDIKIYQSILAHDRTVYPRGIVSGYYGSLSTDATKRFQSKYGLTVTGNFDAATKQVVCKMFQSPAQIADISGVPVNPSVPTSPVTTINNSNIQTGGDLVVTQMAYAPDKDITVGTEVLFGAKEKNLGNVEVPNHTYQLFMNNQSIASGVLEKLGAGQDRSVALYKWTCPQAGNYIFRTVLDPNNMVTEVNEQNNIFAVPLVCGEGTGRYTCDTSTKQCVANSNGEFDSLEDCQGPCSQGLSGKPDLVFVDFTPKDFETKKETDVKISVKNQGYSRTDYSYMDIYISGDNLAETLFGANITIEPLSANKEKVYETKWACPQSGNYTLRFVLDTDNAVDESDETNNESVVQITCSGQETGAPSGFGFACDPSNGQCYVTTVEKGQFTSIEQCMSGCKKQNVAYGCNTQTWQCEIVTTKEEAAKYQTGGATLEECLQVCKPETTQPDQTGGQTGQTQDVGYCYDGSRCVYVDSMQGIKSKYPSVCCGADLNSCQGSCVQQQEPGQTDPGKTTEKSISVSVALEEKVECTAGVLNVLAHVKNTGTEALSNVRLITYGENPTTNSFSEYFNLSAGDVKDLNVKIKCSTPLKAFVWKDVNSNGQVDPNERIPVESQPIGVECATLCKQSPAEDTDKTVGNFSLEVTTFEKFTDKDKLEYENYCGKGNINCAKIKIVPKVGQLADFYNDVIQLAFNGGLKAIYGASVQYKNQDYMFFDFSKACASGDKCTYDISLLINNVLQNLENNTGNLECGSKVPSGDDYTGTTPKEKLASYYVEYIGFDNTSDNLPAYELPIKLGVKEVNYLSSRSVNNFNKLYVLISQNKFNTLIANSYTIDLYSSYDSSLYTRLIRLINSPISGIVQKNNQTYYKYEFADTWVKHLQDNEDLRVCVTNTMNGVSLVNNVPVGVAEDESCFVVNFNKGNISDTPNSNMDIVSQVNQTLDASTFQEMNNILSSFNLNNFDLSSVFNSTNLNNFDLSSSFNNLDLNSNLNNFDLSSSFNNLDLSNFDFNSMFNNTNLNNVFDSSSFDNNFNFNSTFNNSNFNNNFNSTFNNSSFNNNFNSTFDSSSFGGSFDLSSFDFSGFGF